MLKGINTSFLSRPSYGPWSEKLTVSHRRLSTTRHVDSGETKGALRGHKSRPGLREQTLATGQNLRARRAAAKLTDPFVVETQRTDFLFLYLRSRKLFKIPFHHHHSS